MTSPPGVPDEGVEPGVSPLLILPPSAQQELDDSDHDLGTWGHPFSHRASFLVGMNAAFGAAVAYVVVLTIVATLIGAALLGLLGALVAIPAAATVQLILEEVAIPRQNQR